MISTVDVFVVASNQFDKKRNGVLMFDVDENSGRGRERDLNRSKIVIVTRYSEMLRDQ